MLFDYQITFSLLEWLALTGLVQSVFILVYIVFRLRDWRQGSIAIGYFLVLACSFGLQFALRLEDFERPLRFSLWFAGTMMAPFCYLLVVQVVRLVAFPGWRHFLLLLLPPLAAVAALLLARMQNMCEGQGTLCPRSFEALYWLGSMAGALCLLALFMHRGLFSKLLDGKSTKERYWLIMTLIAANVGRVVVNLLLSTGHIKMGDADALQAILGISFAYLAMTTLFRVYPLPVNMSATARGTGLGEEDKKIADKVRRLMELDKLYHEPSFSRADLAREVGTSENTLSRAINRAFGKSFPKLLNEYRVEDAKRMLRDPAIPIQVLAFEVGFNSLASFNRVFREITGETPSHYRTAHAGEEGNKQQAPVE